MARLEKKRDFTIYEKKRGVTAQLICGFVFAYTKYRFSHDATHMVTALVASLLALTLYG